MKQLTCEMCGGTDLMKQDGAFVCQNCGMKYSVEEAKKMMIEIDNTKKLTNLHLRAENAIKVNDYKLAIKCYNQILEEDPNDWKAYFYSYFLDFDKKTAERYYTQLGQILPITYEMAIKNCSTDEANSRVTAITEIFSSELMADIKSNKAWLRELDNIEPKLVLKLEKIKEREERYRNRREIVRDKTVYIDYVFRSAENKLEDFLINNKIEESVCKKCLLIIRQDKYQITSMSFSPEYSSPDYFFSDEYRAECTKKLNELDPTFEIPSNSNTDSNSSGGCYVATCVYGSYDCPQVWALRRYRDYTLAETWYGRAFIRMYYAISPTFVKWFGHTKWFKKMWKGKLDRMVENLKADGVEDTPYTDKNW
jgi:tetratricopeptide (TPR) repeat protein